MAVKVNALKAGDPDRQAFVTHYKVLEAVIEELEKLKPAQILVGDSVGTDLTVCGRRRRACGRGCRRSGRLRGHRHYLHRPALKAYGRGSHSRFPSELTY